MNFLNAVKAGAARLPPKPVSTPQNNAKASGPAPIDLSLFPFRPVPLAFMDAVGEASRGLRDVLDLDEQAIITGCGFLGVAIASGGEHHDEPLWHLAVLASTWFKDGRNVAHSMSNKHAGYSVDDTNDKFDRKVKDRAEKDLGWPSCATISGYGCKECATCPHLAKGQSPLNLGIATKPVTSVSSDNDEIRPGYGKFPLPDGYMFDTEGRVCFIEHVKEKTAEGWDTREVPLPVLDNQHILMPRVHKGPPPFLTFYIDGTVNEIAEVKLERHACAGPTDTLRRLIEQGVRPNPQYANKLGVFFMSLIGKIEREIESTQTKPLGWVEDPKSKGFSKFSYGGHTFRPVGPPQPGGFLDDEMKKQYTPTGELAVWKEAADFITAQRNRQDFHLMLACTTAAPLVQLTGGQNIIVGSFYGDSGKGKSFCLKVGAGYWGDPESTRLSKSSTANHLGHKAGLICNLPVFWDEVSEEEHQKAVLDFAMQDGRERQRLMMQAGLLKIRPSGHWSTILATTSNPSLVGYVSRFQRDNNSGRYRIFEWKVETHHAMKSKWETDPYLAKLRFNFGQPGLIYAEYLARRSAELPDIITAEGKEFDKKVDAKASERFWSTFCACILVGAKINVELGLIDFDVPALEAYLVKTFLKQRQMLEDDGQEGAEMGREVLTAFIKDHFQGLMITDGLPGPGGKKDVAPFKILKQPAAHLTKGIFVQWVNRPDNPIVRISRNRLNEWLTQKKYAGSVVYERVKHRITSPVVLGAKTSYAAGPERVMQIDLYPGHFLYEVMNDLYSNTQST